MSVLQKIVSEKIVGDIIDEAPSKVLKVTYPSGVTVQGTELTPTQVKDQPKVEWEAEAGAYYTLILTDPDAPSRADPKFGEVRHWLVVNIPGNDVKSGDHVIEYIGSGAPKDTGLHRYVFLLFKQTKGKQKFDLSPVSINSLEGRMSTKTRPLIADYNLKIVGGNFFLAQYDDYVPILMAQFA